MLLARDEPALQKELGDETTCRAVIPVHTLYPLGTGDPVCGSLDPVTFSKRLYQLVPPPPPPPSSLLVFVPLPPHKRFGPSLFLAVYLSRRHLRRDLLMDDINAVITLLYIYTHVLPACSEECGPRRTSACASVRVSVCRRSLESRLLPVPRPPPLHMRLSAEMVGRLSPRASQPRHCLGKSRNPVCGNATATRLDLACPCPHPNVHVLHSQV